eukprot:NODE_3087_length_1032_cov_23.304972_g2943_i0.p1 GENE.NODE_3087_length_1032_cov_23.304972_g2943_i0~~NODE_3087_length_1032_cov_23.304972_g2943_i0.p1  ORF type:complete len:328 (+),score=39.81 NODE_3087_length_1032_cov_23.304972_g2943_i0:34-984(+)
MVPESRLDNATPSSIPTNSSVEEKPAVRKFVAPGSSDRPARFGPTAFRPNLLPQREREQPHRPQGDEERPQSYNHFPGRYTRPQGHRPDDTASASKDRKTYSTRDNDRPPTHHRPPPTAKASSSLTSGPSHPLQRSYTFSLFRKTANPASTLAEYEKSIKPIGSFSTVEGFWGFYSHLQPPDELTGGTADFHLFVEGVPPIWEHEANRCGGKFIIRLKKGIASRTWEELLLALVGEAFQFSSEIMGVVASVRFKEDILSVWIRNKEHLQAMDSIRHQLTVLLTLPSLSIDFKPHSSSLHDLESARLSGELPTEPPL